MDKIFPLRILHAFLSYSFHNLSMASKFPICGAEDLSPWVPAALEVTVESSYWELWSGQETMDLGNLIHSMTI